MSLVCGQCSRVNPPEAAYCFHDGAALAGRAGGPINAGAAPFPNQFVFPDGLTCRNFDQLALACQQNWSAALKLLQQGFLGSFFGGMGRVDLAAAAQEAAKFPDLDRGLDQLLGKLPSEALQQPKLQAEPSEINLGQVKIGADRHTELHLTNLGMRLLYGTATSNCKWLLLGDAPGHPEKMFQFGADTVIPVQVRGQFLRAGSKPIEGKLEIDSNGGAIEVTVKADVPITPFGAGLFAGAVTPRQIAEKAKANVKDAVPCFERGDVAGWYASNGWDYPVKGPIMPSTGSIQQFFEALGVAKAPKVEFSPKSLDLHGAVGKTIDAALEVSTTERKVVYGWATCDQPWVEIGKTKLHGKSASIPITIRIPEPCPPTLEATLTVMGNGTQKLAVPLRIAVTGGRAGVSLQPTAEEPAPFVLLEEDAPMVIELLDEPVPAAAIMPTPMPTYVPDPMMTMQAPVAAGPPPAHSPAQAPLVVQQLAEEDNPFAITESAPAAGSGYAATPSSLVGLPKPAPGMPLAVRLLMHFAPLALLCFSCLILIVCDYIWQGKPRAGPGGDDEEIDPREFLMIQFDESVGPDKKKEDTGYMNFGLHRLFPDNPGTPSVKLNYYDNGAGNSTVVNLDGADKTFGRTPDHGLWSGDSKKKGIDIFDEKTKLKKGKKRVFDLGGVEVTQTVTIEPGEPVEVEPGKYKRLLDTCLVRYTIFNRDNKTHNVGLRVLLDTCIGENDGVPFTIAGVKEVVDTKRDFKGAEVPDFVEVLEKETLRDPGTVLHLNLRVGEKFEMPSRFLLTRYARKGGDPQSIYRWEVPVVNMDDDSSVVIYWEPKDLKVKEKRELAYTYGLGFVSPSASKLAISIGGATQVGGQLTVVALVSDRDAKKATLHLPEGLKLIDAKTETQSIEPMRPDAKGQLRPSPVTWLVRAASAGKHSIEVSTDNGLKQVRRVTISTKSLFN